MENFGHPWKNPVILLLLHLILITNNGTDGCATVARKEPLSSTEQLLAAVKEAESRMEDDAIILPKDPYLAVRLTPQIPEQVDDIPEIPLGTTVNFSCSQQRGQDTSNTTMLWRHRNTLIYTNATVPGSSAFFFYSYSNVGQQSFFFVHNISADAVGSVQCMQPCEDGWCATQEFQLRPKVRPNDVFYGSIQNASSRCGGRVSHTCRVRMNCTPGVVEGKDKQYMWKVDGAIVGAPWDHSYLRELAANQAVGRWAQTRNPLLPGVADFGDYGPRCTRSEDSGMLLYEETLTITLVVSSGCTARVPRPHRVQCWFRPYRTGRRWLVQTAYAHF